MADPSSSSGAGSSASNPKRSFAAFRAFLVGLLSGMVIAIIGATMWMHRGGGQTIQPELLLENQRVRVVRWVLQPNQSTSSMTDNLDHISVIVRGTTIRDVDSNGNSKDLSPQTGDAIFEAASNRTHSLTNMGKMVFEVVSIDLKQ